MNRSKREEFSTYGRHYFTVLRAGGAGSITRWQSSCYLVALVRRDGSLERVGLFSERSPTASAVMPVVVAEWQAPEPYDNAHRKMRRGAQRWAWPWIDPSWSAQDVRQHELWPQAQQHEIQAPADVALLAAQHWQQLDQAVRRHYLERYP